MAVYTLLLAVISFTPLGTAQGQECGTENFPCREQFLLNDLEAIDCQSPNTSVSIGYLVIVPQLKFGCHGTITSWHALTKFNFNTEDTVLDVLFHDITFQLWRPSAEDSRVYSFIGSHIAQFIGNDIRAGRTILDDGTQLFNLTSTPPAQERLQFQPGDVIGWYIHTVFQAVELPLSIVYSHATSDDENAVDMFSTVISDSDVAATPPPCDVAICSTNTTLIPSVIPYITVEYETLSDPPGTGRLGPPLCVNNSSPLSVASCHLITPNTPETVSKGIDVPILIAVIIVVVIIFISATFLGVIVVLIVLRNRWSRNSTTQNMYNTNEAAKNVTINLAQGAAYGVTTETQRNKEGSSVVMSENAAYGAAPIDLGGQQQSPHEVDPPYHNIIM